MFCLCFAKPVNALAARLLIRVATSYIKVESVFSEELYSLLSIWVGTFAATTNHYLCKTVETDHSHYQEVI